MSSFVWPGRRRQRPRRSKSTNLRIDRLESRIALAIDTLTIGGEQTATFTDADGDIVGVFISGRSGTVVFRNSTGGAVADGEDIASIVINGASRDFDLSFMASTAGGAGNAVTLGEISTPDLIRGIYTVTDANDSVVFNLTSFSGPGFGKRGGLYIDNVVDGGSISVTGGLIEGTLIDVRGSLGTDSGATLTVGGSASTALAGRVLVKEGVQASEIILNGPAAQSFELIAGVNTNFSGSITANGFFNGRVTNWFSRAGMVFNGGLGPNSLVVTRPSGTAFGIAVDGDVAGKIVSSTNNITIGVTGSILSTGRIVSGSGLTLTTGGGVAKRAAIYADSNSSLDIGGAFAGAVHVEGDLPMRVRGDVTRGTIFSERTLTLTVDGAVTKGSFIDAGNDLTLDIGRGVTGSRIVAVGGLVTGSIGGAVTGSSLVSTGSGRNVLLAIGGRVQNSQFVSSGEMSLDIASSVTKSRFNSQSRAITLDIAGSLTKSTIDGANRFRVITGDGQSALDNTFVAGGQTGTLDIGGDFRGRLSGYGIRAIVDGSVLRGSEFLFEDNGTFDIGGNFSGTIMTGEFMSFNVDGDVDASTRIQAGRLSLQGGGETQSFYVGGDFAGRLQAGTIGVSFDAGEYLLVGGDVTRSGRITLGDVTDSDGFLYRFGGNLDGVLTIGGDLRVDVDVAGRANVITIGGSVIADITIAGALQSFTTGGSLFSYDSPTSGIFITGSGQSGTLSVGSFKRGTRTVKPALPNLG